MGGNHGTASIDAKFGNSGCRCLNIGKVVDSIKESGLLNNNRVERESL